MINNINTHGHYLEQTTIFKWIEPFLFFKSIGNMGFCGLKKNHVLLREKKEIEKIDPSDQRVFFSSEIFTT